jgi:Predicted sugar phosphate isomerase involved in capsule formation
LKLFRQAKEIGGRISLVTSNPDSPIGKISNSIVIIENYRDNIPDESKEYDTRQMLGEHKSFAPLGTLFETAEMTFCDAVISRLMEITQTDESELKGRHANIE